MLITCNNKGCLQASNALLDQGTKKVLCGECGQEITNISDSMKRAMKSFGQVVRSEKKAFMLACTACRANREVVMDQDNNTLCKVCHGPITIHAAFKMAMEAAGGLERVEVTPKAPVKKKAARKTVK